MEANTKQLLNNLESTKERYANRETYLKLLSCVDATALDVINSELCIEKFASEVIALSSNNNLPSVAAICVSPSFVETVGVTIPQGSPIALCSVVGGFPMSQTFTEVKMLEAAMAIENGADEIDVVINVGDLLNGDGEKALSELKLYREEFGDDVIIKVIIESGALLSEEQVRKATRIAIAADADFVKSSTGKTSVGATYQAIAVMCEEVKEHYNKTGEIVGIKVSGGVRDVATALSYYAIIDGILGKKWLNPCYMRIGASSLLNDLINELK